MAERMNDYTERVKAEQGEIVPAEQTAVERQAKRTAAMRTEQEITEGLRSNLAAAVEEEALMLERIRNVKDRDLPQALRAVSDVKSKSLDGLLKITGRSAEAPEDHDFIRMLEGMRRKGYLKLNVSLDVELGEDGAG